MILEGCEVVVKCEGKSMEEYEVTVSEDGKAVACYIASQPGKEFWIEYSRRLDYGPPNTEFAADVYFAGVFDGGCIAPDPESGDEEVTGEIWLSRRGDKFYNYEFSMPELIEGETPSSTDPESIGEIDVRVGFIASSEKVERCDRRLLDLGPSKINEKDKKPGAHCAGPMSEVPAENCTEGAGEVFFGTVPEESALVFTFVCRAEAWLQAENIMDKPRRKGGVEPVPKIEEEAGELKVNELRGLKVEEMKPDAQILKLEEKRTKIPRSRTGKGARSPQPKVKAEREPTTVPMTPA